MAAILSQPGPYPAHPLLTHREMYATVQVADLGPCPRSWRSVDRRARQVADRVGDREPHRAAEEDTEDRAPWVHVGGLRGRPSRDRQRDQGDDDGDRHTGAR